MRTLKKFEADPEVDPVDLAREELWDWDLRKEGGREKEGGEREGRDGGREGVGGTEWHVRRRD